MGSISKRVNSNGEVSFSVKVRKQGIDITKTFFTEEDAKLFIYYKERLIKKGGGGGGGGGGGKENFDVPLAKRITLDYCIDLKLQEKDRDCREISSFNCARDRFNEKLGKDKFLCELTYDDWLRVAKEMFIDPVYRGSKKEKNARIMSPTTLRRQFAYVSSSISYTISKGVEIENHPLKVIQTHISPMIKNSCSHEKERQSIVYWQLFSFVGITAYNYCAELRHVKPLYQIKKKVK